METTRDQAIVLFACATGLRPQEWRAIQWRDIDRTRKTLQVNRTIQNGVLTDHVAKTRGSLRAVMLSNIALEAPDLLPTPLRRDTLLFPGRDGVSPLDANRWRRTRWTAALTAAKVAYREPYGMRDTFATLALNAGLPMEWISKQMGHTEIDTTIKHYARWQRSTDDRMLAAMNAAQSVQTGLETDSANG